MTDITNRIRDLSLQAMNGTYSDKERAMMQEEVNKLTLELYRQRNSTMYNKISVFGKVEKPPQTLMNTAIAPFSGGGATLKASTSGVSALSLGDEAATASITSDEPAVASLEGATVSTASVEPTGANLDVSTLGPQGNVGTYAVEKLTEEEAIAQGYTVIKTAEELVALNTNVANKKFILMGDIDLSGIEWTSKSVATGAEFNGNGYSIDNLTSNKGLFFSNSGTIKNLCIADAEINGGGNIGILVGSNSSSGTIANCSVSGSVTSTSRASGGLAGFNFGTITNAAANVTVEGLNDMGGLVGAAAATSIIENSCASGTVNGQNSTGGLVGYNSGAMVNTTTNVAVDGANYVGGLAGSNAGIIKNASASGTVDGTAAVGGLVGSAGTNSKIENASATGSVTATGNNSGGLVGLNGGTITNANASGDVDGTSLVGGLVGSSSNTIENCSATGNVTASSGTSGGLVGSTSGSISNSYALGNVTSEAGGIGGFAGSAHGATIINSYSKGDISTNQYDTGGFVGLATKNTVIENCYATGDFTQKAQTPGGFVGTANAVTISNSYSTGTLQNGGAFIGKGSGATLSNVYSNSDQPTGVNVNQAGVTAMPKDWFEDSENLQFLGSAYDYYYNPPEIKGNSESYASEFIKFQIGANEGKDNMLSLNLTFKMNFFSADVSSIEKATATLEKVDEFKQTLTEKRAEIGATRNRLESVIESQNVRLENLEASHSTMVDTDFAFEAANLTKMQILQNTTATLLAQANTLPSLALQLLA